MTTAEPKRDFSTLTWIKIFLRSSTLKDRLNDLAILSIGKNQVDNIGNFNEKVFDEFVKQKERRMNFSYK